MVLTKAELISSLRTEVRILLHLITKVDRAQLDYRPTPKQRSTLELIQYMSMMGPEIMRDAKTGVFNVDSWTKEETAAKARSLDQAIAAIEKQKDEYAALVNAISDDEMRAEVDPFGAGKTSRGAFIVNIVLSGCAAYRTQLFLYLKACGRDELSTMNLWAGADAPKK